MDNMIYYFTDRYGKKWYMCKDCGHKEKQYMLKCPVCHNEEPTEENSKRKECLSSVVRLTVSMNRGGRK